MTETTEPPGANMGFRATEHHKRGRAMRSYFISARLAVLFKLFVIGCVASTLAAHYYVSPLGSDANSGTSESDAFATIQAAADVALNPGDIVTIRAGTYKERVKVKGEGERGNEIVFQADGEVIMDGTGMIAMGFVPGDWSGIHETDQSSGNHWIILDGITFTNFRHTTGDDNNQVTVNPSTGWTIRNCTFKKVHLATNCRGHYCTIEDCEFDSLYSHACVAYGGTGLTVRNVSITNGNLNQEEVSYSAVNKFLHTDSCVVENITSEGHVGPGWWFDWSNTNFVFRNNVVRNCRGRDDGWNWEGPGMWIEVNQDANGRIYNNLIEGCTGGGIVIMESQDIEIFNNLVRNCGSGVELRNCACYNPDLGEEPREYIARLNFHDNFFEGWNGAAVVTSIDHNRWDFNPADKGIVFDNNSYCRPEGAALFSWYDFDGERQEYYTLDEVRGVLGLEANGELSCEPGDIIGVEAAHVNRPAHRVASPAVFKVAGDKLSLHRAVQGTSAPSAVYDLCGRRVRTFNQDGSGGVNSQVARKLYIIRRETQ
ncbi:MAG: hypothetical protein GF418_17375 [Chitinivibrionales bacterium]|nr:hypothetical protein [Chitinivibrionales bacterium]MBD3397392.1 hypothetical protein [Chitinivibrionales bacterium]